MASLYKRANGPQQRMLTIVSGAVLNAAHAHPDRAVDKVFARSVAKRAVGTLSASWPEVLAAKISPSGTGRDRTFPTPRRSAQSVERCEKGAGDTRCQSPLAKAIVEIASRVKPMQKQGDEARAQTYIECLRIIDRMVKEELGVG